MCTVEKCPADLKYSQKWRKMYALLNMNMLYWFPLITKNSFNASKRLIKCLNWIQCFFYYKLNASSRIPTILFKVSRWSSTIISRGFWREELCSLHMTYSTRSKRVSPHPSLFLLLPNIYLWSDLAIFFMPPDFFKNTQIRTIVSFKFLYVISNELSIYQWYHFLWFLINPDFA